MSTLGVVSSEKIINEAPLGPSGFISIPKYVIDDKFSIQLIWGGTPTGNLKLQASNDGVNWVDIPGTSLALGGSAGSAILNIDDAFYTQFRVVFTWTLGSGTLTGIYVEKRGI